MHTDTDRPDYVPAWWMGSPRSRLWRDPGALARRLIAFPPLLLALAGVVLALGATVEGVIVLAYGLTELATAVVYAPRALRAARRQGPDRGGAA